MIDRDAMILPRHMADQIRAMVSGGSSAMSAKIKGVRRPSESREWRPLDIDYGSKRVPAALEWFKPLDRIIARNIRRAFRRPMPTKLGQGKRALHRVRMFTSIRRD